MISFSPTQQKAGKAFYSESSSPVQRTDSAYKTTLN